MTILLILSLFLAGSEYEEWDYKDKIVQQAKSCVKPKYVTPQTMRLIDNLADLEKAEDVPIQFFGMTMAKACIETKGTFNIAARGDCKKPHKKQCRAKGLMQFWKWAVKGMNELRGYSGQPDPRLDPYLSASYLIFHIETIMRGRVLDRRCGRAYGKSIRKHDTRFILAWTWVNRGPYWRMLKGVDVSGQRIPRCKDKIPNGYRKLKQWQRSIKRIGK